jgi:predicted aspartyl protease
VDSKLVPFHIVNNTIRLYVLLNRKEFATLLLDTGASHTFLTPDTAKRLGISPAADAPKHLSAVLGGRQVEFPLVRLASLAVGEAVMEDLEVGVLASFPHAPLVDGIVGGSFLKHFTMTVDYATSRLRLAPKDMPVPSPLSTVLATGGARSAIPIQIAGNHILVRALLNHQEEVVLLLDTGASRTILTPETAQRLGSTPAPDVPRQTLRVVDGQLHEVPLVPLAALAVGDAVVENLQVGVSVIFPKVPGIGGLLGGDFLEQFTITLDRTARQMWLEGRSVARPEHAAGQ